MAIRSAQAPAKSGCTALPKRRVWSAAVPSSRKLGRQLESDLTPRPLNKAWRRVLLHAGLPPVRFHDLRHAHATLMLQQGIHPKIVSERLGHSSIGITLDTYSHVLPFMQEEAAKAADAIFGAA